MRILKIVSFVFSTVGVLLLIGSVFIYTNTSRFIRGAAEAEGKVVGLDRSVGSSRSGSTYHPVVEFTSDVFSSVGLSMIAMRSRGRKQAEWLHRNGRRLQTTFKAVELNQALRVNGLSPYHILSQSTDPASKTVRVFKSENIWFDPSEYITRETIDVLVDPGNPQKYVMDIGFLPKLSE